MGGKADLTLASGKLPEAWGEGVLTSLDRLNGLDEFRLTVSGDNAEATGIAANRSQYAAA